MVSLHHLVNCTRRSTAPRAQTKPRWDFAVSALQRRQYAVGPVSPINRERSTEELKIDEDGNALSPVEKAKAIVESRKSGTFTTVSLAREDGQRPLYGSLMPYVLLHRFPGSLIFALRKDEKHREHLEKVSKCSFMIYPLTPAHIKPKDIPLPKVNLTGVANLLTEPDDVEAALEKFEAVHPGSEKFLKDTNVFEFYEFEPEEVLLARSSGAVEQYLATDYVKAPADPIAKESRQIIEYINGKYSAELKGLCSQYGDVEVEEVFIMGLDRFGFDMFGMQQNGEWLEFRFPFDKQIDSADEYAAQIEQSVKNVKLLVDVNKSKSQK